MISYLIFYFGWLMICNLNSYLICKWFWRCGTASSFLRRKLPVRCENPARGGDLRVEIFVLFLCPYLTGRIDESSRLSSLSRGGENPFLKVVQVTFSLFAGFCLRVFGKVTGDLALQLLYYGYCESVIVSQLLTSS